MTKQKLTKLQCQVLVGILLGDASLRTENGGKTYRLQISQSADHKDYVFHLYDIFKNLTTSPPTVYIFSDPRNSGKTYSRWTFSTTQHSCLRFYGHQFYDKNGKKKVPRLIHRLLAPCSIAYWYMDDGAQKWKGKSLGVRFCTDNFESDQVLFLANLLKNKYGLKTTIQKKDGKSRIYVSSYSFTILKELLFPFLIESMLYKFPSA